MSILDKIVDDCMFLKNMNFTNVEECKGMTIEILNSYFNKDPERINIMTRVIPIYEGIYPTNDDELLQSLKDLDFLGSGKRIDLLVIACYSKSKDYILSQLNSTMNYEFNQIEFKETLKDTIISLGLTDLLKSMKFTFTSLDLLRACKNDEMIKHILKHDIVIVVSHKLARRYAQMGVRSNIMAQTRLKNTLHLNKIPHDLINSSEKIYRFTLLSGNDTLARWVLEFYKNINIDSDDSFKRTYHITREEFTND